MELANVLTSGDHGEWNYHPPLDVGAKCLFLTVGKIAITGVWGSGSGVIAWYPLPKRNKALESVTDLSGGNNGN